MKSERLLAITMTLLEKKQISAPELAKMFEVSVRTIYRDIESLSLAGVPVVAYPGSNGGIRIMENYKIDQRFFTTSDMISLLTSLNSLNKHVNTKQNRYTIEKLKSLIPKQAAQEIALKSEQLVIDLAPWIQSNDFTAAIELIQRALDGKQMLSIAYENRNGEFSQRLIAPYRLILKETSWYTQAYCQNKQEFRLFKLSRMKDMTLTETRFEQRELPPVALGKRPPDKEFVPLQLEVDYSVKDQLTERYSGLKFIPIEGSEYFSVVFPHFIPDELGYRLLLSFGTRCKCLGPAFVQKELIHRIRQMLALY